MNSVDVFFLGLTMILIGIALTLAVPKIGLFILVVGVLVSLITLWYRVTKSHAVQDGSDESVQYLTASGLHL